MLPEIWKVKQKKANLVWNKLSGGPCNHLGEKDDSLVLGKGEGEKENRVKRWFGDGINITDYWQMWKIRERAEIRVALRFLAAAVNGNALQSSSCVGLSLWVTKYPRERAGVIFSCDHKVACCQESGSLPGPLYLGIWYLLGPLLQPLPWALAWCSFATIISLGHLPRHLLGHKNNPQAP